MKKLFLTLLGILSFTLLFSAFQSDILRKDTPFKVGAEQVIYEKNDNSTTPVNVDVLAYGNNSMVVRTRLKVYENFLYIYHFRVNEHLVSFNSKSRLWETSNINSYESKELYVNHFALLLYFSVVLIAFLVAQAFKKLYTYNPGLMSVLCCTLINIFIANISYTDLPLHEILILIAGFEAHAIIVIYITLLFNRKSPLSTAI